ncbi:MAG: hypothetical protein L0G63_11665 [Psychrobacter sp.]|uniref:hypothetical protein n=1 Tax=Psychrobacter sp. TaxID=56811 RepID=UPI002647F642|nr:hypothetical protein [Psychrobacter sp.]MDN5621113.1 hypothetical protein [Psychrobacter sp.]
MPKAEDATPDDDDCTPIAVDNAPLDNAFAPIAMEAAAPDSVLILYSEFSIKTIQWDWDKFFAASVCVGTARKENLDQFYLDI